MKDNKEKLEKWVKIDVLLQEKLKDLEALDFQREEILTKAQDEKTLSENLKQEMQLSLAMYEHLAKEIATLKAQAKNIKNQDQKV